MNLCFSKLSIVCFQILACTALLYTTVVSSADEGIFDNRLELVDANFASYSFNSTTSGTQYQVADDFVLPADAQWMLDSVRCTGIIIENGEFQLTIGETYTFNILIFADDGGSPTGTPIDPLPGTALFSRQATATGTDTGFFVNGADFLISFDPIPLDGGMVYWLVVAPAGKFSYNSATNPNGDGWAWIGRSGFGNAWQGGTNFQNNWIDQSRQQDFTLYGMPVTTRTPIYTLTDLGDLPGGDDYSAAFDINNNGQIVGSSFAATGYRGFIWDSVNGMQDLGELPGGDDFSFAYGINEDGLVVGGSETDTGERPFTWDAVNGIQELTAFPEESYVSDLNDNGQFVGNGPKGAFLWDTVNGIQIIEGLTGKGGYSQASSLNNLGQVTGQSDTGTTNHGFVWDAVNGIQDLGDLSNGNEFSNALNINDNGQIIGGSHTPSGTHAFLWDAINGIQDMGDLLGGRENSFAYGINNQGQVVGRSRTAAWFSPFLWDSVNGMQDLNHLLDDSGCGWNLGYAWSINDAGQIVGCGINPDGIEHGFLLTPIVVGDVVIVPDSFLVTRGTYVSGGVTELAASDNADLSLRRDTADNQSRTEFEVKAISPTASPSSLDVSLEGSVFARSTVNQTIELFDYVAATWEQIDTREATRFTDSTVTASATGDLSRFVEAGTMCIQARILYQSIIPRQQFSSNTDQFMWTIGQ